MRDEPFLRDEQREAFPADVDAIDRTPELLERNLADHPRRFAARLA